MDLIERLRALAGSGMGDISKTAREAAAALEAAREDAWQPIETAPRAELEDIIASDGQAVFAVQWFDGQWVNSFSDIVHPTHWRPLPDPPRIVPDAGQGGGE